MIIDTVVNLVYYKYKTRLKKKNTTGMCKNMLKKKKRKSIRAYFYK